MVPAWGLCAALLFALAGLPQLAGAELIRAPLCRAGAACAAVARPETGAVSAPLLTLQWLAHRLKRWERPVTPAVAAEGADVEPVLCGAYPRTPQHDWGELWDPWYPKKHTVYEEVCWRTVLGSIAVAGLLSLAVPAFFIGLDLWRFGRWMMARRRRHAEEALRFQLGVALQLAVLGACEAEFVEGVKRAAKGAPPDGEATCPVCLESLGASESGPPTEMRCGHRVCLACAARLSRHSVQQGRLPQCPLCRRSVVDGEAVARVISSAAEPADAPRQEPRQPGTSSSASSPRQAPAAAA
eukprot:TRINITY_DN7589_c0_g2_i1.p1 TRINITY_DN7589_c0_g2~~TRINITY_DN7589_c0_g2_i1.p1  ORF type:complete len:342 (+),score=62.80 TRINITY_DN7589_c0_g2_i1:133-1026(+)